MGTGLGQMRLEKVFDYAAFVKPNVYYTRSGDIIDYKFGSLRRGLAKKEDYAALLNGETVVYKVRRLEQDLKGGGIKEDISIRCIRPPDDSKRVRVFNDEGK